MPIGVDDFKKLMEKDYFFVDKSNLIVDILKIGSEVTLITRPRRFGKTLNLSMLRYFFDLHDAAVHRGLFEGLAVSRDKQAMAAMGQYPVLMLSLKGMKSSSLDDQLAYFKTLMKKLYEQHVYLYDALDAIDKDFFDRVRQEQMNESQVASSLEALIRFMARYHDKKVVVLIDEYDHPLPNAFYHGFDEAFGDFYRNFMGTALKGNVAVQFAVVTGIMQMAGSGMFSDLNNATMLSLLDEPYATAFGFTEQEVQDLLCLQGRKDKLEEVKHWYNGYLFGEKGHVMYNPWSVLQYVSRDCVPKAYWVDTSDNRLLKKELYHASDTVKAQFVDLLAGHGTVSVPLNRNLRFAEMGIGDDRALWMLLLSSGYLKARVGERAAGYSDHFALQIPNAEVRYMYQELFYNWLVEQSGSVIKTESLLKQLLAGDTMAFCQSMETLFMRSVSMHDAHTDPIEHFYHGFVLGLLALADATHEGHLRSNNESGLGRFDITLEPRSPGKGPGIVFELKRLDAQRIRGKTEQEIKACLEEAAKVGMDQIKTKAYDADLRARGVDNIAYIALAFSGKQIGYQCEGPNK